MLKNILSRSECSIFKDWYSLEEVTLQLIKSKCLPALLYGLEACPLTKSDLQSPDFVINRFFVKLFTTRRYWNCEVLSSYRVYYGPSA